MRKNTRPYILIILFIVIVFLSEFPKAPPMVFVKLSNIAEANTNDTSEINTLTFDQLEQTRKYIDQKKEGDITGVPEGLSKLNGKMVKITGNLLIPSEQYYMKEPLDGFAVSKNAFGCPCCTWGPPPTIFDSVFVTLKEGERLSSPYGQNIRVVGIFRIEKKYCEDGSIDGLFYITNATCEKIKKSFLSDIF